MTSVVNTNSCSSGGDTQGTAPLTVTDMTLHWAAEVCTIGKMYKADRALYIEGRCSNGGLMTRHPITLAMKGERLAGTWNGAETELQRCPGEGAGGDARGRGRAGGASRRRASRRDRSAHAMRKGVR